MGEEKQTKKKHLDISLSGIFVVLVMGIVCITSIITILWFVKIYRDAMEENAATTSNQAVTQVRNMVEDYALDMKEMVSKIEQSMESGNLQRDEFINNLVHVRNDVVAVTTYDNEGNLLNWWADTGEIKKDIYKNLSYVPVVKENILNISKPHVETLFHSEYPWVVTISQKMRDKDGQDILVCMDIRFSHIAKYVDDVGIGKHGYCYIEDQDQNIIYHPQQQLIYSGLKNEIKRDKTDGIYTEENVIYTTQDLESCNWSIVGVCYVEEMVTSKVENMVGLLIIILVVVIVCAFLSGITISKLFTKPASQLAGAMREFEKHTENFTFEQNGGTTEIYDLSNSFEHMVVKIQKLMEQVRQEEITLRKTELKALQAQINPHFLYNTLDAIAWLCEDGRNKDAEEMVNSLARLFRISISKGHELITIEKELQHAESYLKIEKYRYKDQFEYIEDIDEECLQYLCNKITLQPIIENAIYHGLNRMVDEGEIRIGIHQDGDDILFTIADNGVGMTKEQCEEILHKEPGDRTGIGIKNVDDRIKIYFGEEYGLEIESEVDEGTTVKIRMPKITEGGKYEK